MSASLLLEKLERVKRTGPDRWQARCPAHEDKGPSLSIRELDDGRVLCHCFAGCQTADILAAVGLSFDDLFPIKNGGQHAPGEKRPWPAADVLRAVGFEALVVAQAAATLLAGEPFGPNDRERLIVAAARLNAAVRIAGIRYVD